MATPPVIVACLCAAWCRLCDDYASVLERIVSELEAAGAALQPRWIDIEDEADLVGDFDVETFPTLVVIDSRQVRFAGPLTPQPETLRRVLRSVVLESSADARWPQVAAEVEDFAMRLRQWVVDLS